MAPSISVPLRARLLLWGSSLLVGVFTFVYARLVCAFICTLSTGQLARTVLLLSLFHVGLRELLLRFPPPWGERLTPARRAHLLSVASWLVTGLVGFLLHAVCFPSFPFGSHFKFALGYWLLGGALLSQVEHLLFEHVLRPDADASPVLRLRERLGRRLLEGYVTFTTVPVLVLMLSLLRFMSESGGSRRFVLEAMLLATVFTGTALVAALFYGRSLRRDSERLLEAVRRIGQGDFQPGVSTSRPDELALVARGINEMADGLLLRERIREAFGRFVSREVADEFIEKYARHGRGAEMGGSRREVVVLFSDLRDFTPLSESLPPEALIEVLNGYFAEMVAAIRQHGAWWTSSSGMRCWWCSG
jgi:adenylate cyclase